MGAWGCGCRPEGLSSWRCIGKTWGCETRDWSLWGPNILSPLRCVREISGAVSSIKMLVCLFREERGGELAWELPVLLNPGVEVRYQPKSLI